MNKSELIEALAEDITISRREATSVINTIVDAMTKTLVENENIEIRGFGSFSVKQYGSYQGRNPKTGKKIQVKPKKLPLFRVGKDLKDRVNVKRK